MKVVHVSSSDTGGGAARSAYRLHQGLSRLGHDSSMFVSSSVTHDAEVTTLCLSMDLVSRVRRVLLRKCIARDFRRYRSSRPSGCEPFHDSRSPHHADFLAQLPRADIVQLHWIADSFVDYEGFFSDVPRTSSVVWTLHDMNAFTGGCHYNMGCDRYADQCGCCPQLGSSDPADLAYQVWSRKRRAFSQIELGRLRVVTPSHWLAREVKRSALGRNFSVSVIPYGIDLDAFAPRDQAEARRVLGLPTKAGIVLFLADNLQNERKGFSLLAAALAGLAKTNDLMLVSLGWSAAPLEVKVPCTHLGFIDNERLLSLIYSAADLFVIPSLQDNLPNTVLEAMACGTPVVGFDVGGIPEMVREGLSGTLVPPGDVAALRAAIVRMLANPKQLADLSTHCRRIATEEYALELQARRYAELYAAILDSEIPASAAAAQRID